MTPDDHLTAFRLSLAALRRERGHSLRELAGKTGMSPQAILNLEGKAVPSLETALRLADALGVPLADMIGGPRQIPEKSVHLT